MECYKVLLTTNDKEKEECLMTPIKKVDYSDKTIVLLTSNDGRKYKLEALNLNMIDLTKIVKIPDDMLFRATMIIKMRS